MVRLGENQKAVLRKAVVKNESTKVTHGMAKSVYGDNSGAKKCLRTLAGKGILEEVNRNGGVYKITNLPEELYSEWVK